MDRVTACIALPQAACPSLQKQQHLPRTMPPLPSSAPPSQPPPVRHTEPVDLSAPAQARPPPLLLPPWQNGLHEETYADLRFRVGVGCRSASRAPKRVYLTQEVDAYELCLISAHVNQNYCVTLLSVLTLDQVTKVCGCLCLLATPYIHGCFYLYVYVCVEASICMLQSILSHAVLHLRSLGHERNR